MNISHIPDNIHEKIIVLSTTLSSRDIAKKIEQEDNFKISHATVNKYIKQSRKERSEIFKTVITQEVGKNVTKDLAILEDITDTFYAKFKTNEDLDMSIKLSKALRETIELKFKSCGSQEQQTGLSWEAFLDEQEQEDYLY